jgi:hypothetical protein
LWADGVLGLLSGSGGRALTQLLAGRVTGPCAGIDVANDGKPFLGLFERREVTHVKAEALAAFLAAPADEEREALELRQLGLLERHRCR